MILLNPGWFATHAVMARSWVTVYRDEHRLASDREIKIALVVHLNDRRHPQTHGALNQTHQRLLIKARRHNQNHVGPCRTCLPQLVAGDHKITDQYRNLDFAAHGQEIGHTRAMNLAVSPHTHAVRTTGFELSCQGRKVRRTIGSLQAILCWAHLGDDTHLATGEHW